MRIIGAALAGILAAGLSGAVAPASARTTDHIYVQTVQWVSKDNGPKATVKKYGESYGFAPSTIIVHQGDSVTLTIRNLQAGGDDGHTFTLSGYGINKSIPPLAMVNVTFVANKAGVFPFQCEFHKPWMHGELVVMPR